MRMTIDTTARLVSVEDNVNIVDFIATVKNLFPDNWEEYNVSRTGQPPYVPMPYYNPILTTTTPVSTTTTVSNNPA